MKRRFLCISILCILLLSGCKIGVDLDSKENALIAEYAAGVMIMHSHYYDDRYDKPWMYNTETEEPSEEESSEEEPTTEEPTTEEPTTKEPTTEEPTTSEGEKPSQDADNPSGGSEGEKPSGDSDDKPSQGGNEKPTGEPETEAPEELNLTEVFGTHPVEVSYVDYLVCDSYDVDPDGFFEIVPEKGNAFLVLNFTLNNRSFVKQTVSTGSEEIIVRLTVNDEEKYNNYDASMLMNDLTSLKEVTLESKEVYNAVIIYMIPTEIADNIDSMYIEVATDMDNKGILELK